MSKSNLPAVEQPPAGRKPADGNTLDRNAAEQKQPSMRSARPPALQVLFATSEIAPLIKTGGLADVSASLPAALRAAGHTVRVVLPAYADLLAKIAPPRVLASTLLYGQRVQLLESIGADATPPVWLLHMPGVFDRAGGPYTNGDGRDWSDNGWRFGVFCAGVAWIARGATARHADSAVRFLPDVVHANDWPAALSCALLADESPRPALVLSIHNLAYHGRFGRDVFDALRLPAHLWHWEAMEFHGDCAFLKAGLTAADELIAVSPGYAREITQPQHGNGLDGVLRARSKHLHGIVNGIDLNEWNPATDRHITQTFDAEHIERKSANRAALRKAFNLPNRSEPLLGMISRLTWQKGSDIVLDALPELMALGLQLVVLGSGDAALASAWATAARQHPKQIAFVDGFDEALAHRIEAGADVFLMPSRYEPCGLNQLYSLRYGTVPVVHATGGLADTVQPLQFRNGKLAGTGFHFSEPHITSMLCAVQAMLALWRQPEQWRIAQHNGMTRDLSWRSSVAAHEKVYVQAIANARTVATTLA